jgi:hypothetical protein
MAETMRTREDASIRTREEPQARRRRDDLDLVGRRLAVNRAMLDHGRFEYRYVNDDPARLHRFTVQDDWDVVSNDGGIVKADATDMGDAVSVVVGTKPDGSPLRAYLCRKPKKFYDEDQRKKQTELDEQLKRLRNGKSAEGEAQGDYIPRGGISIAS